MSHGHTHGHDHAHDHATDEGALDDAGVILDLSVPDTELAPAQLARRGFLRRAGILGAGIAGASVLPNLSEGAVADERQKARRAPRNGYSLLAGDHHIHTQHSSDGMYRVADQVKHASAYGLDWMVITDHGSVAHAKIGVEKVNPDIVQAGSSTTVGAHHGRAGCHNRAPRRGNAESCPPRPGPSILNRP